MTSRQHIRLRTDPGATLADRLADIGAMQPERPEEDE